MIGATLFSGIGAPETAMPSWHWPWHAEIEKFPAAVLARRHPDSENLGDVTADDFCERALNLARPDVLVFGSPCQSYSIAGKRLGLDDPRGNLALVALGIVARLEPRWFVFENVPGLLSSSEGRDYGIFLRTVDELRYSGAWASLDAQHFGVAQRRKRLFFVGHSGDWRGPAAVLFEPEGLCGDTPPRDQAGQGIARAAAFGISPDCFDRSGEATNGTAADRSGLGVEPELAYSIRAKRPGGVALALNAHGGSGRIDYESETFVAQVVGTLPAGGNSTGGNRYPGTGAETAAAGYLVTQPLICFQSNGSGDNLSCVEDQSITLRAGADSGWANAPAVTVALRGRECGGAAEMGGEQATALRASQGGGDKPHILTSAVRRLTPRECERLQGYPDDHTLIIYRGKPAADGPRYKALGNSMAVPVMEWILSRVAALETRSATA